MRMKVYKILTRSYSVMTVTWTIRTQNTRHIRAAGVEFLRITAGYSFLHHQGNETIVKEPNIVLISEYICDYSSTYSLNEQL